MLGPDERPDGTVRIYFVDNTYKTLPMKNYSSVEDVIQWLCKRLVASGRPADSSNYELLIIAPGTQSLRERRLLRQDKPLQILAKGGASAFKFLFREALQLEPVSELSPGDSEMPHVPADMRGRLRAGCLERLLEDDLTWYSCTVILDEERLWYSQAPGGQDGRLGGGMAFLQLSECDSIQDGEDKQLLQLMMKSGRVTFRAKSSSERSNWLLAIVKQAALIKERDILLEAELIIAGLEFRRSGLQLDRLEALSSLSVFLSVGGEARHLFLEFLSSECFVLHSTSEDSTTRSSWPQHLDAVGLLEALERHIGGPHDSVGADSEAWHFTESILFPKFLRQPAAQSLLCRIAAGVT